LSIRHFWGTYKGSFTMGLELLSWQPHVNLK